MSGPRELRPSPAQDGIKAQYVQPGVQNDCKFFEGVDGDDVMDGIYDSKVHGSLTADLLHQIVPQFVYFKVNNERDTEVNNQIAIIHERLSKLADTVSNLKRWGQGNGLIIPELTKAYIESYTEGQELVSQYFRKLTAKVKIVKKDPIEVNVEDASSAMEALNIGDDACEDEGVKINWRKVFVLYIPTITWSIMIPQLMTLWFVLHLPRIFLQLKNITNSEDKLDMLIIRDWAFRVFVSNVLTLITTPLDVQLIEILFIVIHVIRLDMYQKFAFRV